MMTKQEFISALREKLSKFDMEQIEESLSFYSEMIDERIEEGLAEEEAVEKIGDIETIVSQISADIEFAKKEKKAYERRRLKALEIILLVIGAPLWLSLLIAAFLVVLSLYIVLWSLIGSCWSIFGSFVGCAIGGIIGGVGAAFSGAGPMFSAAMIGAGIVCAGLSIFSFFGCKEATKGAAFLTKKIAVCCTKIFSTGGDKK